MPDVATLADVTMTLDTPRGVVAVPYQFDLSKAVQAGMYGTLSAGLMYEPELTRLFATILREGDVFVDVGAHCGYFSRLAAQLVGQTGRVVSFEPNPDNFAALERQMSDAWQFDTYNVAVGAVAGSAVLHTNADNDGGHAMWDPGLHPENHKSRGNPASITVPVVTLNEVLGDLRPRAMKMDIEGCEVAALGGAGDVLRGCQVPFVTCEVNRLALEAMGTSEQAMRALMAEYGYETWLLSSEAPELRKLADDETQSGPYVFNLLFRAPGVALA